MKSIAVSNIKIHPRSIEAMGASLVTNDNVAILELVKNAYDAFAHHVNITIGYNNSKIVITDDGIGMNVNDIINSWATISTTFKIENKTIERNGKMRVVSGNKGLGRLSASRLGKTLTLITKSENSPILKTVFVWDEFYTQENTDSCKFEIFELDDDNDIKISGTKLIIENLEAEWTPNKVAELKIELERLINPFNNKNDFVITMNDDTQPLTIFNYNENNIETIEVNELISDPPYKFSGIVDEHGNIKYNFEYVENYNSKDDRKKRSLSGEITSDEIKEKCNDLCSENIPYHNEVSCGKFSFEIRIWEMQTDYLNEIANRYGLKSTNIVRKIINNQKGISVYRDGILVLPKSENSRDWMGLDKKRISQIGRRLSTSQIIGQINISIKENPYLLDTTSRESFVKNKQFDNFYAICVAGIINKVQQLRLRVKPDTITRPNIKDYFKEASPEELNDAVDEAIKQKKTAVEVQQVVREYSEKLEKNLNILKEKVEYYAQLASAGTFSKVIIHEIKNSTNPIKRFNKCVHDAYSPFNERIENYYKLSCSGCDRLLKLSDAFSPLNRTTFKKEKHMCDLYSEANNTLLLMSDYLEDNNIKVDNNISKDVIVKLHSGELQTIFINLIDNAIYWLCKTANLKEKKIQLDSKITEDGFVEVKISDNGMGIDPSLGEKIFEPGITSKPTGFGMGLVVVNEIVSSHAGYLKNIQPGEIDNGATFVFTVPKEK